MVQSELMEAGRVVRFIKGFTPVVVILGLISGSAFGAIPVPVPCSPPATVPAGVALQEMMVNVASVLVVGRDPIIFPSVRELFRSSSSVEQQLLVPGFSGLTDPSFHAPDHWEPI